MTQHHLLRVDGRNGGELNVHDTDPGGPPKWSHLPGAAPVLSRWRNPQKVAPSNWRATSVVRVWGVLDGTWGCGAVGHSMPSSNGTHPDVEV